MENKQQSSNFIVQCLFRNQQGTFHFWLDLFVFFSSQICNLQKNKCVSLINFNVCTRCNNGEFFNALNIEVDFFLSFLILVHKTQIVCLDT